jgi:hypothetical protein
MKFFRTISISLGLHSLLGGRGLTDRSRRGLDGHEWPRQRDGCDFLVALFNNLSRQSAFGL